MKITIITLYRGIDAETFVGAVSGELTLEQKKDVADEYIKSIGQSRVGEDVDEVGFAVVDLDDGRALKMWASDGHESGNINIDGDIDGIAGQIE